MNINMFYFVKIKNLSCRFMKARKITYSRWVTYRGQQHVINAVSALFNKVKIIIKKSKLYCYSLDIYELNGLFVKLSFVRWVPAALNKLLFNLNSWDMNSWSTTKSKFRHYYNKYEKKLKTNSKYYRTNMIPVNSLYEGLYKEGRGSVVFCSRRRDLNTYTYFKKTKRFYSVNKIQDKSYWSSKSKNVQVPNGPLKIQDELRSLYNRNLYNDNWINKDLFRILRHIDLWIIAYVKLSKKPGSITIGIDKYTIDGTSFKTIKALQKSVLTCEFRWGSIKRVTIPKPNVKESALGVPKFQDRLVQCVLKEILEKIYEPIFSTKSHGFRPGKSQHTALKDIRKHFGGVIWFIEGYISSFFDSINHKILMEILSERIQDKKFLNLINWGLKSDIISNDVFIKNNLIGTFQGGILSPLLSNIYLDKFDKYIEQIQLNYNKGIIRASNKQYVKLVRAYGAVKFFPTKFRNILSVEPFDENFKRIHYIRYANDFILGIIGSKQEAFIIKEKIKEYLNKFLKLELNLEKTLIKHRSSLKFFLGYSIGSKEVMYKKINNGKIKYYRIQILTLFMNISQIIKKLNELGYCDKSGNPTPNFKLLQQTQSLTNLNANSLLIGLNNYYKLANDRNRSMNRVLYILKTSIAKMYAAKYKKRTIASIYKIAGKDLNKRIKAKNPIGFTEGQLKNYTGNVEEIEISKIVLPLAIYNKPDLSVHYNAYDEKIFNNIF